MCSVQTKKKKKKKKIGIIIRILMWSWSCLLVFWARLVKTCNKKGEAEMHWTVGQLIGLVRHLLVSDCIPLYHRMILNYYKSLKLYLISNHKLGMAPLLPVGFTETCPVYLLLTVTLEHEPSLQVFGIGIPLLCWFNCLLDFLFIPLSSSCYDLWNVCYHMDAATVTQTSLPF